MSLYTPPLATQGEKVCFSRLESLCQPNSVTPPLFEVNELVGNVDDDRIPALAIEVTVLATELSGAELLFEVLNPESATTYVIRSEKECADWSNPEPCRQRGGPPQAGLPVWRRPLLAPWRDSIAVSRAGRLRGSLDRSFLRLRKPEAGLQC